MLLFKGFTEWTWVWLASKEVNYSTHQLIPLFLVVLTKILTNLVYVGINSFNSSIDIAFLGISYRPKLMFFLDYFREIPKFRWPSHIFWFERVVNSFHMFECFGCALKLLILTFSSWKHALPNDWVFNILMNCFVYMLKLFNSLLNYLISEIIIAVVLPNPITS